MSSDLLYIGLMSGTSVDAVDVALVSFPQEKAKVEGFYEHPIPTQVQRDISELCQPGYNEIDRAGELDQVLGELFSEAVLLLLDRQKLSSKDIHAIGSHGQTIRHRPRLQHPFTLQIGNPSVIAYRTGITTVADFRAKDMAAGGQGAPLVPAFHQFQFFDQNKTRVILNVGGIANISLLSSNPKHHLLGFDTGPGNTLMDYWVQTHLNQAYDNDGEWARSGQLNKILLEDFIGHQYFCQSAPKSTGREEFSSSWLKQILSKYENLPEKDIQRTLCELTARSISTAIQQHTNKGDEVLLCGGGAKNSFLVARIASLLSDYALETTDKLGIDVNAVEATAFAWLAYRTMNSLSGNRASVTGADRDLILGGVYPAG
ncbi:MAG: anhydro-N-acetylmuramic acid kinase [Pseudomonadales bacterium]|nr:anhydro-N-acetylmuramic acid kinase [Pseudomonadales bacterium]